MLKIMSYLRRTNEHGVSFAKEDGLAFFVYVDADYAKKAKDRRSIPGRR